MMKAKVNTDSKAGVALRKCPYVPCLDEIVSYVKNETIVTMLEKDVVTDLFGDNVYVRVRLDSGKEGYALRRALEVVK